MPVSVDRTKFDQAHDAFLKCMLRKGGGTPFTGFGHHFFREDEWEWKHWVRHEASEKLDLKKWAVWRRSPGQIVQAVKKACSSAVSKNLLEHRYGPLNYSEAPLYRVEEADQVAGLESQLFDFFHGGEFARDKLGPRFDSLAEYLRSNHLGCKWPFLAYLAFLACPERYFPVMSTHFDDLLRFYGVGASIAGRVTWDKYSILLDLADDLGEKLAFYYGPADMVQIQSYMWVVTYLVRDKLVPEVSVVGPDFTAELTSRIRRADERERIGLKGECWVHDCEKRRLTEAGRADLAEKVQMVSIEGDDSGFDIRSFETDGREFHIEVKTTSRSVADDLGFWISQSEVDRAKKDASWVIYRVCDIDLSPSCENLGNLLRCGSEEWRLAASGVYATRHLRTIGGPKP